MNDPKQPGAPTVKPTADWLHKWGHDKIGTAPPTQEERIAEIEKTVAQAPPKTKKVFTVARYQGTAFMGDYGRPFDTLEAAEKHLAFVRKTVVGYSGFGSCAKTGEPTPNQPFHFEVREFEETV